jgi:hypothetical protein
MPFFIDSVWLVRVAWTEERNLATGIKMSPLPAKTAAKTGIVGRAWKLDGGDKD